jgi:hypothetical protein
MVINCINYKIIKGINIKGPLWVQLGLNYREKLIKGANIERLFLMQSEVKLRINWKKMAEIC